VGQQKVRSYWFLKKLYQNVPNTADFCPLECNAHGTKQAYNILNLLNSPLIQFIIT